MSSAPLPVDILFPSANEQEAWDDLRSDYKRFEIFDAMPHQPIYDNLSLIVRYCPNAILTTLVQNRLEDAVDQMKQLYNFIHDKGFLCQDTQAMVCLSDAMKEESERAIELIRQFQRGTILGLQQATDEEFEQFRLAVLERSG